jgi:hypothetical protein
VVESDAIGGSIITAILLPFSWMQESGRIGAPVIQKQNPEHRQILFPSILVRRFSMRSPRYTSARTRFEIRGLQHLKGALETGKGAILWLSNSFGRKFLAKQVLHDHEFSVHQIYGENHAAQLSVKYLGKRLFTCPPLVTRETVCSKGNGVHAK